LVYDAEKAPLTLLGDGDSAIMAWKDGKMEVGETILAENSTHQRKLA